MFKTIQDNIKSYMCLFFFKHYPGLFIPLDKRHPKCVPVTIQVPDQRMLTGAESTFKNKK